MHYNNYTSNMNSPLFDKLVAKLKEGIYGWCPEHPTNECMVVNGMTLECCHGKTTNCKKDELFRLSLIIKELCGMYDELYKKYYENRQQLRARDAEIEFMITILNHKFNRSKEDNEPIIPNFGGSVEEQSSEPVASSGFDGFDKQQPTSGGGFSKPAFGGAFSEQAKQQPVVEGGRWGQPLDDKQCMEPAKKKQAK